MVISTQAAFGRGTRKQFLKKKTKTGGRIRIGVNYLGHSYQTRLLFTGMPKRIYTPNEKVFNEVLEEYADQFEKMIAEGGFIASDGTQMFLINLGLCADWPALIKAGKLKRHFNLVQKFVPKKGNIHEGKGICHICLGGKFPIKWESTAMDAEWVGTIGEEEAWTEPGALARVAKYGQSWKYLKFDCWHNGALGVLNVHVASTVSVLVTDIADGNNIDVKIDVVNDHLLEYLSRNKLHVSFQKLTKDNLGWATLATFPYGKWSKASDSVILSVWLEVVLQDKKWENRVADHPVLSLALVATKKYNALMSALHREDYFIFGKQAVTLGAIGMGFMQDLETLANKCYELGINRYLFLPKNHAFDHSFRFLLSQGHEAGVGINPLAESLPMSEDFIGTYSRQSRRVSPRLIMLRSLQSYLIKLRQVWSTPRDQ